MRTLSLCLITAATVATTAACGVPSEDTPPEQIAAREASLSYSPPVLLKLQHATSRVVGVAGHDRGDNVWQERQNSYRDIDQRWQLVDLENGYFAVRNVDTGWCLDVAGSSTANSANILQWTCYYTTNQQWQIQVNGSGYLLRARHSSKCLDVQGSSSSTGANILQYTCYYTSNQRVKFIRTSGVVGSEYHPSI